jgi:hypothetical protein
MRAEHGTGPETLGIDIGMTKMIITHAAAVHGLDISRSVTGLEVEREALGRPSREKTHEYRNYRCRS